MASTKEIFLKDIEAFLVAHNMSPSLFGSKFAGSPSFVFRMREGRAPNLDLVDKIDKGMAAYTKGRKDGGNPS